MYSTIKCNRTRSTLSCHKLKNTMKTKKHRYAKTAKNKYTLPRAPQRSVPTDKEQEDSESESKSASGEKNNSVSIEEYEQQKQEIMRLRRLTQTMQSQTNKVINLAREGKMDAFDDSFRTTVIAVTKRVIYPLCQYISNSEQLDKCMKILGNELALSDAKKAVFQFGYKHTVNSAIASRRNADVQAIRKELKGMLTGKLKLNAMKF